MMFPDNRREGPTVPNRAQRRGMVRNLRRDAMIEAGEHPTRRVTPRVDDGAENPVDDLVWHIHEGRMTLPVRRIVPEPGPRETA